MKRLLHRIFGERIYGTVKVGPGAVTYKARLKRCGDGWQAICPQWNTMRYGETREEAVRYLEKSIEFIVTNWRAE